jgi:hypothetical protein
MNRGQIKSGVLHLVLLIGLCSAIGAYLILTTSLITKDGVFYIEQARLIATDPVAVCRRYPPGYPFLIWAGHRVASFFAEGDSPARWACSAQTVTLLCRVLALIPLYLLGRRLAGAANSFWALFVLVILPYPAFYGSDVLREWPYLLFLGTGMLLLHWGLASRRWWVLGLVGLDAGLGSLIRPECAQLILYAGLALIVVRREGAASVCAGRRIASPRGATARYPAFLLLGGFVAPVLPYVHASGGLLPHQLRVSRSNTAPVIGVVGTRAGSDAPLEFDVRVGETLELPIRAADGEGDPLSFSLVAVPPDARPVYLFRSTATGAGFWTLNEQEKERLLRTYAEEWDYEGVDWYAYARPDVRPGLRPVCRFWSAALGRHFYTMSPSEQDPLLAGSAESWTCEGAVLYAFGPDDPPPDAAPVYRVADGRQGCSWVTTPPAGADVSESAVAWFVPATGPAPAGASVQNGVFRWRPAAEQQGDHPMNLLATDGRVTSCQLLIVHVRAGKPQRVGLTTVPAFCNVAGPGSVLSSFARHKALRIAISAVDELVDALMDDFMIIPVLPWILGLVFGLRSRAGSLERALILSVLILTTATVLARHIAFGPGSARRYCLPMIALTIFYLPMGLDVMTRVLNSIYTFRGRLAGFGVERRPPWFYLLLLGGLVLCTPKLIRTPLRADKAGYRAAAEWLVANTPADAVIADPDRRICFYADRPGLLYERCPNWRKADFVVVIAGRDEAPPPQGWTQAHSVAAGTRDKTTLIVYAAPAAAKAE